MTLKFVDSVPAKKPAHHKGRRTEYNKVLQLVEDFRNDHREIAVIQCTMREQYKNPRSLACCVGRSIREAGYPIRVHIRGDEVYLVKY